MVLAKSRSGPSVAGSAPKVSGKPEILGVQWVSKYLCRFDVTHLEEL
jgi:hypothetical protein